MTVIFVVNHDEIAWRFPENPWHTYILQPAVGLDRHQVWNFLHTCPGNICIVPRNYTGGYEILFDIETAKDKFEMFAKLSEWGTPTLPTDIHLDLTNNVKLFSQRYFRRVAGLPQLDDGVDDE